MSFNVAVHNMNVSKCDSIELIHTSVNMSTDMMLHLCVLLYIYFP